jgi:O-succinylbenzoic acid--CoA ligase
MNSYNDFLNEWQSNGDYMIAHTSGSTGAPKEIRLLKSDMIASAKATNDFFGVRSGDNLVCPLSLNYIAAKMMAVRAIVADANLILIRPSNDLNFNCNAKILAIVPSQVDSLIAQPQLKTLIENVIIGGAPLVDEKRQELITLGYNAFETYGMTETCSHVALKHITEDSFSAVENITFDVDNRDCLIVNVPHMSIKRVITNDVVKLYDNKTFTWLGRYDNVINSGGIKIHPEVLEKQIAEILGSKYTFYIAGAPHPKWGQQVILIIEANQDTANQIMSELAIHLDHKYLPKKVIAVRKIQRTSNGKIIRQILGL